MFTRHDLALPYTDTQRLAIFKAAQAGNREEVASYLQQVPELIHAKTTTKGSSLLHIAANAKNFTICEFLLKSGHDTNPVDKERKTPYQETKIEKIRQLLVSYHSLYLYNNFYTVSQTKRSANILLAMPEVLSREAFTSELLEGDAGDMSYIAFGHTSISTSGDRNHTLSSKFREDILMLPYYGELLVIHENEVTIQQINFLNEYGDLPVIQSQAIFAENLPLYETVAFCKFVAKGLELYPFLADAYPAKNDSKEIIEFKKMFIAYGLLGFASNSRDCSPQQLAQLKALPHFQLVVSHTQKIISSENSKLNTEIFNEMTEKYTKVPENAHSLLAHV